jgi:hypothetical protein
MKWIDQAHDTDQWRAVVRTGVTSLVSREMENSLSNWATSTMPRGVSAVCGY